MGERGVQFEARVLALIRRLERVGLATNVEHSTVVIDKSGVPRQVDISFTLRTLVVDIRVTVECKSKTRSLSLEDIDQIRLLRASLPARSIFWLVSESGLSANAASALLADGISHYAYKDLSRRIRAITLKSCLYMPTMTLFRTRMDLFNTMNRTIVHGSFFQMRACECRRFHSCLSRLDLLPDFSHVLTALRLESELTRRGYHPMHAAYIGLHSAGSFTPTVNWRAVSPHEFQPESCPVCGQRTIAFLIHGNGILSWEATCGQCAESAVPFVIFKTRDEERTTSL